MMNHQSPPNWVKGRADCSLDLTFDALAQIVERDVKEANELPLNRHVGRSFRFETCDEGTRTMLRVEQTSPITGDIRPQVGFEKYSSYIMVNGGGVQFSVRPRWDEGAQRCRLFIRDDDRAYEVWEISQRALIKLFFEY